MDKQQKQFVEDAFKDTLDRDMLKFTRAPGFTGGYWLEVEYKSILNFAPRKEDDYKWRLIVAMDVKDMRPEEVIQRIIFMLAVKIQSLSQDVNGILEDYILKRKDG